MADSISRITSMFETARDLTLEAATAASSRLTIANTSRLTTPEIMSLLNSRTERDVYQGLKSVIAMISRDEDASKFYTDVVKNVTSSNLKIKKLVYTYLLKYTDERNEDVALLSINAIQKSLYDQDEQCRALAMRMISEIKILSIYQIVMIGLKKCVNDPSPLVRKSAAIAVVKIYQNHIHTNDTYDVREDLMPHLEKLLKDSEVIVLDSAVLAFKLICPDNYALIHGHYRRFVKMIDQFDEWSQIYLVEMLTDYARRFLPRPKIINLDHEQEFVLLPDVYNGVPFPVYDVRYHPDLELFLVNIRPLVHSFNESLIMAVARAYFHLTPPKTFREVQIPRALVRVLSTAGTSEEVRVGMLQMIVYMVLQDPMNFVEFTRRFYVLPGSDSQQVVKYKLKILSIICNENNIKAIISELQNYIVGASSDVSTAIESVRTLGICCQISEFWSGKILKWMLWELSHDNESLPNLVRSEFLTVIRYLIQRDKQSNLTTIVRLALILTDDSSTLTIEAKESIVWIIGEFAPLIPKLVPDILRVLLKQFHSYPAPIRYQVILLSAKIYICDINEKGAEMYDFESSVIAKMYQYAMQLGRYDDSIDVRDRSRFLYSLLANPQRDHQLASLILQVHKQAPMLLKRGVDPLDQELASSKASLVSEEILDELGLQTTMIQYVAVPAWSKQEDLPPDSIRDEIEVKSVVQNISSNNVSSSVHSAYSGGSVTVKPVGSSEVGAVRAKKYNLQSLDDFLNDHEDDGAAPSAHQPMFVRKKKIVYEEVSDSDEEEEEESSSEEEEEEESEGEDESEEEEESEAEEESEEEEESHELNNNQTLSKQDDTQDNSQISKDNYDYDAQEESPWK
ncbi:hypothetical protein WICPIJ_008235 [Wickerhamomyces pijperi]|uniref:Clathrin/coatomer adaptor adaptin-like N-terminal domain-containing protein n=1 Tax=Wickerhamomyces pijperi TaxID=599730 RepID=A0A9P8Q0E5_WICPI|nr:hypothetical protein WICPIJ_008235 [Wickerhamomyces pijperi]